MIIWFGIDELSKVLLIFLSVLAPMALHACAGVKSAAIADAFDHLVRFVDGRVVPWKGRA